jgi:hypothetical protein
MAATEHGSCFQMILNPRRDETAKLSAVYAMGYTLVNHFRE